MRHASSMRLLAAVCLAALACGTTGSGVADPGTGSPDAADVAGTSDDAETPEVAGTSDVTEVSPAPAPLPADYLGLCPLDGDPSGEHWDRMAGWGVRLVRQGFFWGGIEKVEGTFDFAWSDRYMDEAARRGIGVLVTLDYDTDWIHAEGDPRPSIAPADLDRWLAYVRAVAGRYKDRAWGFEVWNEPNLPNFWKGTMEDFVTLAKATVDTVHAVAPGRPVAVAGLSLLPLHWLDALHAAGVVQAADAISFHPYWLDSEGAANLVRSAKDWMAANGVDKPLWLTEYGWPSGGTYPTATDVDGQAERLIRFHAAVASMGGVRATWWYASRDYEDPDRVKEPDNSEGFFGLAYPTAGDKPAGRAFAVLARLLPGTVPDAAAGAAFTAGGALVSSGFRAADGSVVVVATNESTGPAVLALPEGAVVEWPQPPDPAVAVPGQVTLPAGRSAIVSGGASIAGDPAAP